MTPARHARSRLGVDDTVPVDLAASGAFVDDLTLITADDHLLDCIAAGQGDVFAMPQQFSAGFPAGSLAPLLATWRSEIVAPQWPSLPTAEQAQEAVRAERRPVVKHTRRALKPMLGVAIAISALLFSSAAVGAQSARPGDALWPLTRVLYSDRADSYAAGEAAKGSLDTAESALSSGNPTSARLALTSAHREMDKVKLSEVKAPLEAVYETLMSRASVAAVTESEQSAAKVALESSSAAVSGAIGSVGAKPTPSGTSTSTKPTGTSSGTTTVRSSGPGAPVIVDPTLPAPPSGTTAPVTAPANPTDPAPTPTNPTAPVTSDPTDPASPTAPVTSDPGTTDPVTTDPGTTDPVTTDPSTDPSTDPVTTEASTTSELPTPTQTPSDPSATDPGPNVASIAPAAAASQ